LGCRGGGGTALSSSFCRYCRFDIVETSRPYNFSNLQHSSRVRQQCHYFSSTPFSSTTSSVPVVVSNHIPNNNGTNNDNTDVNLIPIDFDTSSYISGEESQILEITLRPNQILLAESGAMLYMTEGITMETSLGGTLATGRGEQGAFATGLARIATGQNLMVSEFRYISPPKDNYSNALEEEDCGGTVGLGTDFPAKILKFNLHDYPNQTLICQKGAFMAGSHTITIEMAYTATFTAGFFGGEGFILQKLRNDSSGSDNGSSSTCFIKGYGTIVKRTLQPDEILRIASGSLVCMTSTVKYDVTTMTGYKNVLFGGEGLFVTTLTGPGIVWLQGTSITSMVSEIARRIPSGGGGIGFGIPIGMGSGGGTADGGGGENNAGGNDESGVAESNTVGEGGMSENAIEADRNATVASSGMSMSSSDPDSSESLFGDAAYSDGGTTSASTSTSTPPYDEMGDGIQLLIVVGPHSRHRLMNLTRRLSLRSQKWTTVRHFQPTRAAAVMKKGYHHLLILREEQVVAL
jgi:uncharacterized protein (AIM24 family)